MASIPQVTGHSAIPDEASNTPDTFKIEFHPSTGRPAVTDRFSAFTRTTSTPQLRDEEPWHPFLSETDFEFAEVVHQAALSKEQTETLLKIIWKVSSSNAKFSFKMYTDVCAAWTNAASLLTPVRSSCICAICKLMDQVHIYIV